MMDAIRSAISRVGDSDTLAVITGSMAEDGVWNSRLDRR